MNLRIFHARGKSQEFGRFRLGKPANPDHLSQLGESGWEYFPVSSNSRAVGSRNPTKPIVPPGIIIPRGLIQGIHRIQGKSKTFQTLGSPPASAGIPGKPGHGCSSVECSAGNQLLNTFRNSLYPWTAHKNSGRRAKCGSWRGSRELMCVTPCFCHTQHRNHSMHWTQAGCLCAEGIGVISKGKCGPRWTWPELRMSHYL